MNKLVTIFAFLLFLGKISSAQSIVSFKSLGHNDELLGGVSSSISYFVRIDPAVQIAGSKLVLFIEPSQVLFKPHSYINIMMNDKPIYSTHVTNDSIMRFTITLNKDFLTEDGRYLKLGIRTALSISDNKCKDVDNPAMWVKIKAMSYFSFIKSNANFFNNVNISNCFDTKAAIVYPANPSLTDLKAVGWAYARLKRTQLKNIAVYSADQMPDSLSNYIVVGDWKHLSDAQKELIKVKPDAGQGLLYLHKAVVQKIDTVYKDVLTKGDIRFVKTAVTTMSPTETLFITGSDEEGYNNTINTLANTNIIKSSFGDYLLISKAENNGIKTIDESKSRLSLHDMGGLTTLLEGIGALRTSYSFKNSDFSFTPKEIEVKIAGYYSNLNILDRGFFNIYLNGVLLSTEKLDASGKLNTTAIINRYELQKYNTLECEFRFYPGSGNCENSFINYFGEVNVTQSYLQTKIPFVANNLSFYQYPEAFNAGKTTIVISRDVAKYTAATVGEIVYELNNNLHANNFPDFVYSNPIDKSILKKNSIIALLSRNDALMTEFPDAPIHFDRNFRLYNNENNKVVYQLNDNVSNGLAQIFYGRGNNGTLIITATGNDLANAFLSAAKSITDQLSTLASNICIADSQNKYLFNINKDSDNLEYTDSQGAFAKFWEAYNLYILLVILVLILVSFLYVRSRVQKSQESFAD